MTDKNNLISQLKKANKRMDNGFQTEIFKKAIENNDLIILEELKANPDSYKIPLEIALSNLTENNPLYHSITYGRLEYFNYFLSQNLNKNKASNYLFEAFRRYQSKEFLYGCLKHKLHDPELLNANMVEMLIKEYETGFKEVNTNYNEDDKKIDFYIKTFKCLRYKPKIDNLMLPFQNFIYRCTNIQTYDQHVELISVFQNKKEIELYYSDPNIRYKLILNDSIINEVRKYACHIVKSLIGSHRFDQNACFDISAITLSKNTEAEGMEIYKYLARIMPEHEERFLRTIPNSCTWLSSASKTYLEKQLEDKASNKKTKLKI